MPLIKPTVGRSVRLVSAFVADQPETYEAALITRVWGDRCVNLVVFDRDSGAPRGTTSVTLRQPGDVAPSQAFCEYLPDPVEELELVPLDDPHLQTR